MGGEVHDVFARLKLTAENNDMTIQPYGVPYPAIGIDVVSSEALFDSDLSSYTKSVELGAHAAAAELDRVHRACPDTGVIVAGYSQGAQAIVEAVLSATPGARSSLLAAVLFGNTYFDSSRTDDDFGDYAPGLDGYLVHSGTAANNAFLGGDWAAAFGTTPIFDYCHDGDPICGLVDEREIGGMRYPVRDFAHIVSANATAAGNPSIFTHHTDYRPTDTRNAAQQLRAVIGLPLPRSNTTPHPSLTDPGTIPVGSAAQFNAGGALSDPSDPIVDYRWTVDGDSDDPQVITTTTPLFSTAFFTTGSHTVALRATTASGRSGTASVTVNAITGPVVAPATPTQVTAAGGDGSATVSWPQVPGAEFYAVTDDHGTLLTAFTPLVPQQQTVSWTDTGLRNGRSRSYQVYAVNSMGSSPASQTVNATPQAARTPVAEPPVHLPLPGATLIDPELSWALGLGLIVVMLASALVTAGRSARPSRPRGDAPGRAGSRSRATRR